MVESLVTEYYKDFTVLRERALNYITKSRRHTILSFLTSEVNFKILKQGTYTENQAITL